MPIIYRLDLIQNASLAAFYFEERKNWNLMKWAEESFGVHYSDALLYVRLTFYKDVAQQAAKVTFHPSQKNRREQSWLIYRPLVGESAPKAISRTLSFWLGCEREDKAPDSLADEYRRYLRKLEKAIA